MTVSIRNTNTGYSKWDFSEPLQSGETIIIIHRGNAPGLAKLVSAPLMLNGMASGDTPVGLSSYYSAIRKMSDSVWEGITIITNDSTLPLTGLMNVYCIDNEMKTGAYVASYYSAYKFV